MCVATVPALIMISSVLGKTAKSPYNGHPAPLICVRLKPYNCFSLYLYQASLFVSGLHCTIPKGSVAPGNVLPPPAVPISGSTESYGVVEDCPKAEVAKRNGRSAKPQSEERTRISEVP